MISNDSDELECPICFDAFENNDESIMVDCCNKTFHISCLVKWYSLHSDQQTCFFCNQINTLYTDLIFSHTIDITPESSFNILVYNANIPVNNIETNIMTRIKNCVTIILIIIIILFGFAIINKFWIINS